jgi:hypothetical protein
MTDTLPNSEPSPLTGQTTDANPAPLSRPTLLPHQQTPDTQLPPTDARGDGLPRAASSGPPPLLPGSLISDKGEIYTPPARPKIVTREKPVYKKRKAGDPPRKPGKIGWIWGTKLTFFEARKDVWVTASETKQSGNFYLKMAKLYTAKYGIDLGDDEDFEHDVADPPDWVADKVTNIRLSPEETASRQAYHSMLKAVCGLLLCV